MFPYDILIQLDFYFLVANELDAFINSSLLLENYHSLKVGTKKSLNLKD